MHLKKRLTFHGVEYIVVPVTLWESLKDWSDSAALEGWEGARNVLKQCSHYEGLDEELTDE